jgi:hypothetical protein
MTVRYGLERNVDIDDGVGLAVVAVCSEPDLADLSIKAKTVEVVD